MTMKKVLLVSMVIAASAAAMWIRPEEKNITNNDAASFAVVELFTSQGCSSCPPADALLKKINREAQRGDKNIYVLSFHVDYWNYIGWKDPFSSKEYSNRQRQYAAAFGSGRIYTPQAIVNGKQDVVGSREQDMRRLIESELNSAQNTVIQLEKSESSTGEEITVNYTISAAQNGSIVNFALVEDSLSSNVTRGENTGRHLEHTNVVRQFKTMSLNSGENNGSVTFAVSNDYDRSQLRVIAYAQDRSTMRVLAANSLDVIN